MKIVKSARYRNNKINNIVKNAQIWLYGFDFIGEILKRKITYVTISVQNKCFQKSLGQHNAFIIAIERNSLTEKTLLNHLNFNLYTIFFSNERIKNDLVSILHILV